MVSFASSTAYFPQVALSMKNHLSHSRMCQHEISSDYKSAIPYHFEFLAVQTLLYSITSLDILYATTSLKTLPSAYRFQNICCGLPPIQSSPYTTPQQRLKRHAARPQWPVQSTSSGYQTKFLNDLNADKVRCTALPTDSSGLTASEAASTSIGPFYATAQRR